MPRTKEMIAIIVSILVLASFANSAEAAGPSAAGNAFLLQQLPFSTSTWIPVATVAVLIVITIAAIVYALSGTIGSTNARNWSRTQIYEALLSLVLIAIFGAFSYTFFINPQGAFSALGLVPKDCTTATNIFELATCDLSMFNIATFKLAEVWYDMSFFMSLIPGVSIKVTPIPLAAGLNLQLGLAGLIPLIDINLLNFAFGGTLTVLLLQQIQLILISSSMLFLSLFLTLGLIARTFGFSRSFGGAMIAFGLGLGLIYPLLVSVTYGYIDVQAHTECLMSLLPPSLTSSCSATNFSLSAITNAAISLITQAGTARFVEFYTQIGYLLAGITFIPFLNFIILDTFIIDFSQAIGEKMDFMALLAGVV